MSAFGWKDGCPNLPVFQSSVPRADLLIADSLFKDAGYAAASIADVI